jgi:glycosyltransferase involved in cell wall biosynthesis
VRILFVVGDISGCGGTERVTTEIATGLSSTGHDVTILSLFGPAQPFFDLPSTVKVASGGVRKARRSLRRYTAISLRLYAECQVLRADVMVLVDTILFAFCAPWLPMLAGKIICWEHFNLSTNHGTHLREVARLAASRLSHRIVVLTEDDAQAWRKRYRINKRVRAISNPIPRFDFAGMSKSVRQTEPRIVLGVGRLTHQKGFDVLLSAWRLLGEARKGWALRIVGSGEEASKLRQLAKEFEVTDSVLFVGETRDVEREYLAASLFAMSSRWEGLPMTLLEAQYFGLPSISADCMTGPSEVLSCDNGLLVPVEDSVALAEGLKTLMADPAQRERFSAAALRNVGRYEARTICQQWETVLSELYQEL